MIQFNNKMSKFKIKGKYWQEYESWLDHHPLLVKETLFDGYLKIRGKTIHGKLVEHDNLESKIKGVIKQEETQTIIYFTKKYARKERRRRIKTFSFTLKTVYYELRKCEEGIVGKYNAVWWIGDREKFKDKLFKDYDGAIKRSLNESYMTLSNMWCWSPCKTGVAEVEIIF